MVRAAAGHDLDVSRRPVSGGLPTNAPVVRIGSSGPAPSSRSPMAGSWRWMPSSGGSGCGLDPLRYLGPTNRKSCFPPVPEPAGVRLLRYRLCGRSPGRTTPVPDVPTTASFRSCGPRRWTRRRPATPRSGGGKRFAWRAGRRSTESAGAHPRAFLGRSAAGRRGRSARFASRTSAVVGLGRQRRPEGSADVPTGMACPSLFAGNRAFASAPGRNAGGSWERVPEGA